MFKLIYLFRNTSTFFSIENIFRQVAGELTREQACQCESITLPSPGFNPGSLLKNARFVRKLPADIYHVTGDVHYIALFLPGKKTVLTIHDCVFMYQNRGFKKWVLRKLLLDWPVRHCRLITTVSDRTKKDILRLTGCPENKIVVIPNPVSEKIVAGPAPFNTGNPVLLFIGTTPNKNLALVIDAIRDIPCTLDIIGRIPAAEEEKLKANKITYRNSFNLSDAEIVQKYAGSDIVLFPSVFEGFGMPIIEGQRAGRAVLTSDLPPMNEVAGEAACLVDPYKAESIREGLLKIIRDTSYREQLVRKGLQNAQRFTPENIAALYLECYKKMRT